MLHMRAVNAVAALQQLAATAKAAPVPPAATGRLAVVRHPRLPQLAPPLRTQARRPILLARSSSSSSSSTQRDSTLAAALNAACNAALQAMLANDKRQVPEVEQQLQQLRMQALEEQDAEVSIWGRE